MPKRALVVTCDRWHIDFNGCYGNDWIETPTLQKLAAGGVVFDRSFAACVAPELASRAWWTARTQLHEPCEIPPGEWGIGRLPIAGVRCVLIAEESEELSAEPAPPFDETVIVTGRDDLEARESETPFARGVQRVEQWLKENAGDERPTLLWLRSRGIPVPWLPPQGFADLYLEDFSLVPDVPHGPVAADLSDVEFPPEAEFAEEELCEFAEEQDLAPEQARVPEDMRYALAMYAAYASLLDRWLGRLLGSVAATDGWHQPLIVFTAAAGQLFFSENQPAGALDALDGLPLLRGDVVQTPLIVRLPGTDPADLEHAGTRRAALVQSIDLLPSLCEWFQVPVGKDWEGASWLPVIRQQAESIHEELLIGDGAGGLALRTADEMYVEEGTVDPGTEPRVRLHDKPSDRWDANDVSSQAPALIEELSGRLRSRLGRQP